MWTSVFITWLPTFDFVNSLRLRSILMHHIGVIMSRLAVLWRVLLNELIVARACLCVNLAVIVYCGFVFRKVTFQERRFREGDTESNC